MNPINTAQHLTGLFMQAGLLGLIGLGLVLTGLVIVRQAILNARSRRARAIAAAIARHPATRDRGAAEPLTITVALLLAAAAAIWCVVFGFLIGAAR